MVPRPDEPVGGGRQVGPHRLRWHLRVEDVPVGVEVQYGVPGRRGGDGHDHRFGGEVDGPARVEGVVVDRHDPLVDRRDLVGADQVVVARGPVLQVREPERVEVDQVRLRQRPVRGLRLCLRLRLCLVARRTGAGRRRDRHSEEQAQGAEEGDEPVGCSRGASRSVAAAGRQPAGVPLRVRTRYAFLPHVPVLLTKAPALAWPRRSTMRPNRRSTRGADEPPHPDCVRSVASRVWPSVPRSMVLTSHVVVWDLRRPASCALPLANRLTAMGVRRVTARAWWTAMRRHGWRTEWYCRGATASLRSKTRLSFRDWTLTVGRYGCEPHMLRREHA